MNFKNATQTTPYARTENGAETFASSGSGLVDFFFKAGSARNMPDAELISMFYDAYSQDSRLAMQMLAWLRDIRGGAGERRAFRTILRSLALSGSAPEYLPTLIRYTAEFGRYDDLLELFGTPYQDYAVGTIWVGLTDEKTAGLAAKWMPRKGEKAAILAKAYGMSPRQWRKIVVGLSNTVEQKMCAGQWSEINYNHVPSVASSRYRTAFYRHDETGYKRWKEALVKNDGTAKVNASAIFPHDVLKGVIPSYWSQPDVQEDVVNAQWNALPNYLNDADFILPIVDVSGSMTTLVSGNTSALEVAVSLGLYLATRQQGAFSDLFMTFSNNPEFVHVQGDNIVHSARAMSQASWGMSTNLEVSIALILATAINNNVPASEMPTKLLILSDMEFNYAVRGGTNFESIQRAYRQAGYEMPQVVFWNINSRQRGNSPVTVHQSGTALISGFSPSILKGVLTGDLNPEAVFKDTVDVPRYRIY